MTKSQLQVAERSIIKKRYPSRVIFDRSSRFCLPVDVRFAPKATELLRRREMTRRGHEPTSSLALDCARIAAMVV